MGECLRVKVQCCVEEGNITLFASKVPAEPKVTREERRQKVSSEMLRCCEQQQHPHNSSSNDQSETSMAALDQWEVSVHMQWVIGVAPCSIGTELTLPITILILMYMLMFSSLGVLSIFSGLWLVNTGHVTWVLASDWSIFLPRTHFDTRGMRGIQTTGESALAWWWWWWVTIE